MRNLIPADGPLLEQILDATHELWHEGLSRSAYGRYFAAQMGTPWGRKNLRRFALVDGRELLASAKLYEFAAILDGHPLRIAGIGAVFTQPRHRGCGIGRDLMARLLDTAAQSGCDTALLFSEIDPAFYARLGFEPIATCDLRLQVTESARRGAPAALVRAGEDRDLPDLVAMDAARGGQFRWRLVRDRDLVHYAIAKKRVMAGLSTPGARELQFFVAEEGASAVAYVVVSVRNGDVPEWTIESCGDRDPSGARLGAILQSLIARDPAATRPSIIAWLPAGFCPPQVTIVDRRPPREVMMWRAVRPGVPTAEMLSPADVFYWRGDLF